jgi:type IV pilus assembly protein PilA
MKTIQKGFTLIELMIVVAIIAILAAIAIPAYQDYIIRSQVTEGLSLADGAKTAVAEFYSNKGVFPTTNASAGLASATSISGSYVTSVAATGTGLITITYGGSKPANTKIATFTLILSAKTNQGSTQFTCKVGTINPKYVPTTCR